MAIEGGEIAWADQAANDRVKKQKQALSNKLTDAFGIQKDPIEWKDGAGAYVAHFVLQASGLRSQRR
jgi:hypothetical protein